MARPKLKRLCTSCNKFKEFSDLHHNGTICSDCRDANKSKDKYTKVIMSTVKKIKNGGVGGTGKRMGELHMKSEKLKDFIHKEVLVTIKVIDDEDKVGI